MSKKILVIDDDQSILSSLKALFESEGYVVQTLANTDYVKTQIINFQPDIIVIDYMLSGTTGCDICSSIRRDGKFADIPVIMMSAYPSPVTCIKKVGINDFVSKPFEINELLTKVDTHLS